MNSLYCLFTIKVASIWVNYAIVIIKLQFNFVGAKEALFF